MACFICKGHTANKNTTFMVEIDHCIFIVKNVPSQVCVQCGEVSYANEIAQKLENIIEKQQTAVTEITVVNYTANVA